MKELFKKIDLDPAEKKVAALAVGAVVALGASIPGVLSEGSANRADSKDPGALQRQQDLRTANRVLRSVADQAAETAVVAPGDANQLPNYLKAETDR